MMGEIAGVSVRIICAGCDHIEEVDWEDGFDPHEHFKFAHGEAFCSMDCIASHEEYLASREEM